MNRPLTFAAGFLLGSLIQSAYDSLSESALKLSHANRQVSNLGPRLDDVLRDSIDKLDAADARVDDILLTQDQLAARLDRLDDEAWNRRLLNGNAAKYWRGLSSDESTERVTGSVSGVSKVHDFSPTSPGDTEKVPAQKRTQEAPAPVQPSFYAVAIKRQTDELRKLRASIDKLEAAFERGYQRGKREGSLPGASASEPSREGER